MCTLFAQARSTLYAKTFRSTLLLRSLRLVCSALRSFYCLSILLRKLGLHYLLGHIRSLLFAQAFCFTLVAQAFKYSLFAQAFRTP